MDPIQSQLVNTSVNIKCKQCDVGYIIKDYVHVLIQLLTNDIAEFNMENRVTKCLNTAVMLMYFMIGEKGIQYANACDCETFNKKNQEMLQKGYFNMNNNTMRRLRSSILSKNDKERCLYYILLTDAQLSSSPDIYFPGHVVVIEKVPFIDDTTKTPDVYYNVYQSYINEYDLQKYHDKNNTFHVPYNAMRLLLGQLNYILNTEKWDDNCRDFWKNITHVDSPQFVGATIRNKFFICYQKVQSSYCLENLENYVEQKLAKFNDPNLNMSIIYGNSSKYSSNSRKFANHEVKGQLNELLNIVKTRKMSLIQ